MLVQGVISAVSSAASCESQIPQGDESHMSQGDVVSATSSAASCKSRIPEKDLMEICYCSKQAEMEDEEEWRVIRTYLVEKIFAYIKIYSDGEREYEQPNFLTSVKQEDKEELRIKCERLLSHLHRKMSEKGDYCKNDNRCQGT